MTIRELAKEMHCSYEAVRQQTKRYEAELAGHMQRQGKTQYLDEYACDFLRSKRSDNPVIIQNVERDELVEQLRQEKESLLQALNIAKDTIIALKDENHTLAMENKDVKRLEADNGDLRAERDQARVEASAAATEAQKASNDLLEAEREIQRMKAATLWQRLRGFK